MSFGSRLNGADSQRAKNGRAAAQDWLQGLIRPFEEFGYNEEKGCAGCDGTKELVVSKHHNNRIILDVPFDLRLSVMVYAARRGSTSGATKPFGRNSHYGCLIVLIYTHFHPTFLSTFLYFADVIHQEDKLFVAKASSILLPTGRRLLLHIKW